MIKIKSHARTLNQIKEESFQQRVIRRISKISNSKRLIEESKKFSAMILRGLAEDFRKINNSSFLQERGKRKRGGGGGGKTIDLSSTMAALGKIKEPKVSDILSRELESLLNINGVNVPEGAIKPGGSAVVKAEIKIKDKVEGEGGAKPAPGAEKAKAAEPAAAPAGEAAAAEPAAKAAEPAAKAAEPAAKAAEPAAAATATAKPAAAATAKPAAAPAGELEFLEKLPSSKEEYKKAIDKNKLFTNDDNSTGEPLNSPLDRAAMFVKAVKRKDNFRGIVSQDTVKALSNSIEKDMAANESMAAKQAAKPAAPAAPAVGGVAPAPGAPAGDGVTIVRQKIKSLSESLKRKYRLGLITLREYNVKKQQLDNFILKEEIKRQVKCLIKK